MRRTDGFDRMIQDSIHGKWIASGLACLLFGSLGFLGNWFKFELFFNVDFLPGSFFVMLAILLSGEACGIASGFLVSTCTYFLWNHPWAILIMTGEAVFVSQWISRRRDGDLIIGDLLYWGLIGMPLVYFFYHHVMAIPIQITLLVMLKQAMNGITNSIVATIVFLFIRQWGKQNRIPYFQTVFVTIVSLVLIPAILLLTAGMRIYLEHENTALAEKLSSTSVIAQKILSGWIREKHLVIQTLAALVGNPDTTPPSTMQHYVETLKATSPVFFRMGIINSQSRSIAYSPLEIDGQSTLGVDFSDRPYIAQMKEKKQPYIPDVVMGKFGNPIPISSLISPVVVDGEYMGYAAGVIAVSELSALIKRMADPDTIHITLVDGNRKVIASTYPNLGIMDSFQRPYSLNDAGELPEILHWIPEPQAGTSIMQRWRASLLVTTISISPDCRWKVIVEASFLPLVEHISLFSIKGLALLLLLTLGIVMLSHLFSRGFVSTIEALQDVTRFLPLRLADETPVVWPESRIIELEALCTNFREMALALTASFHDQQALNATLEKRVAKRTDDLRDSEEKLRLALESALMGTFDYRLASGDLLLDEQTRRHWGFISGMQPDYPEILARVHPDDRERIEQEVKQVLNPESGGYFESEYRIHWPDGSIHWAIAKGRVYFDGPDADRRPVHLAGIHIDNTLHKQTEVELALYREHLEAIVADRTHELMENNERLSTEIFERKLAEYNLRMSREQMRGLASRLQAAREEERIGVAREIHDVLAQELTRLKFDMVWLQRQLTKPGNTPDAEFLLSRISEMSEITDIAIHSVQKIATELRPAVLDSLGLCAAIEWQSKDFQARTGIVCQVFVPPEDPPISRDAMTAIFRILQESLTNVLRHAGASRVDILLKQEDNHLVFTVQDNGCGIPPDTVTHPESIGLTGMRERAMLLGGEFSIRGRLPEQEGGGGTVIEVQLSALPSQC